MDNVSNLPDLHDRRAEEALLGSVLINQDAFYEVADILKKDDFKIIRHQWAWDAYAKLASSGEPIDLVTVSNALGNNLAEYIRAYYGIDWNVNLEVEVESGPNYGSLNYVSPEEVGHGII